MNIVIHADCKDTLKKLVEDGVQVDSIVTDPPYELGFMNKDWDKTGIAYDVELWKLALQVLKPGGHLLSFSSSKTYHRMACAIEDAGFEIRDQIMWIYGQGFPKSLNISKAIDKKAGAEREVVGRYKHPQSGKELTPENMKGDTNPNPNDWEKPCNDRFKITAPKTELAKQWEGWGTALKPAHEPIVMARKPLSEKSVAENVARWDTGGINIDGCRVETKESLEGGGRCQKTFKENNNRVYKPYYSGIGEYVQPTGRFPANLIHDGSDEVEKEFAKYGESMGSDIRYGGQELSQNKDKDLQYGYKLRYSCGFNDKGTASRFFYCAKASKKDRCGSKHPTVKPIALMRYLCRLVTPPNGKVLDPFAGTGTTGQAAKEEGFNYILIEKEDEYIIDIQNRLYKNSKSTKQDALTF